MFLKISTNLMFMVLHVMTVLFPQILKTVPWYTERMVVDISLGGLLILVTTRTVQYNLLKMRVGNQLL